MGQTFSGPDALSVPQPASQGKPALLLHKAYLGYLGPSGQLVSLGRHNCPLCTAPPGYCTLHCPSKDVLCSAPLGHCVLHSALPLCGIVLCTAPLGCALHCPSGFLLCPAPLGALCYALSFWGPVLCNWPSSALDCALLSQLTSKGPVGLSGPS